MSCTAVTRHIYISVPHGGTKVPFKECRINFLLGSKAKIQRRNNTCLGVFVAAYGAVWSVGGFAWVVNEVIFFDDVITAGVITICNVFVEVFALRYQALLS